jgi:hydrogenase maturation protease
MTVLVLCVGHPDRGDDAAGPLVADLLRQSEAIAVRRMLGDVSGVLTDPLWDEADHVVIVDTVRTGGAVGTVLHWEVDGDTTLPVLGDGAHDVGVATTLGLARSLGRLPRRLTLLGIEGATFGHGLPPAEEVLAAASRVAAMVTSLAAGDPASSGTGPRHPDR